MGSEERVGRLSPSAPPDCAHCGESLNHVRAGQNPWPRQRTARSDGPYPSPVGRGSCRAVDNVTCMLPASSLALEGSHGGAAGPPYRNVVGRTCWSAETTRKQAQRCWRPSAPKAKVLELP